MQTKFIVRLVFGLAVLILGNGCATKALWDSNDLEAWNQPAENPNLRLFQANPPADTLVVYDEYSERHDASHTRAYWLNENQKLIAGNHAPHFVSTNSEFYLKAVPVLAKSPAEVDLVAAPYAVVATNGRSFTLFSDTANGNSHDLPFYNDGKGKVEKFVLTPLASTADLTVIGGVLGILYLDYRYGANAGFNIPSYPTN